jgi:hypothetical protein
MERGLWFCCVAGMVAAASLVTPVSPVHADAITPNWGVNLWFHRQRHRAIADQWGLDLLGYEGGMNNNLRNTVAASIRTAVQADPRLADAYRAYEQTWREGGGDLMMHYTLTSYDSPWGLLNAIDSPGSIKWDAVMGLLLPGGDLTLDGEVTFEDFIRFLYAYEQPGTWWWEQGDFTADNVVDMYDWLILFAALAMDELTPAQRDAVLAFHHAIPEPAAITSLVLAGWMLTRRRRR